MDVGSFDFSTTMMPMINKDSSGILDSHVDADIFNLTEMNGDSNGIKDEFNQAEGSAGDSIFYSEVSPQDAPSPQLFNVDFAGDGIGGLMEEEESNRWKLGKESYPSLASSPVLDGDKFSIYDNGFPLISEASTDEVITGAGFLQGGSNVPTMDASAAVVKNGLELSAAASASPGPYATYKAWEAKHDQELQGKRQKEMETVNMLRAQAQEDFVKWKKDRKEMIQAASLRENEAVNSAVKHNGIEAMSERHSWSSVASLLRSHDTSKNQHFEVSRMLQVISSLSTGNKKVLDEEE